MASWHDIIKLFNSWWCWWWWWQETVSRVYSTELSEPVYGVITKKAFLLLVFFHLIHFFVCCFSFIQLFVAGVIGWHRCCLRHTNSVHCRHDAVNWSPPLRNVRTVGPGKSGSSSNNNTAITYSSLYYKIHCYITVIFSNVKIKKNYESSVQVARTLSIRAMTVLPVMVA